MDVTKPPITFLKGHYERFLFGEEPIKSSLFEIWTIMVSSRIMRNNTISNFKMSIYRKNVIYNKSIWGFLWTD